MKTFSIAFAAIAVAILADGCHGNTQEGVPQARTGTLKMDNLTPDQQIAKVQNDPQIPEGYKQTFINSMRAKQGQAPIGGAPAGAPAGAPSGGGLAGAPAGGPPPTTGQ